MLMKERFLSAVTSGQLGCIDNDSVIVELRQFKAYFNDIESDYINSFLPAATIEKGRTIISHTRYLFRIRKGVYRVHPKAIDEYLDSLVADENTPSDMVKHHNS